MTTPGQNPNTRRGRLFASPYLLLCLTTLFWGGNAVAGKLAVGEMSSVALTFFRWVVACLFMLPFAWQHVINDWPLIRRHWLLLFALGGAGLAGFNLVLYWALRHTSVVNVVIEQAAIPMLIMLFNFVAFKLTVRPLQIAGLILAVFGVVLTVSSGDPAGLLESGVNVGDAIMMLGALIYATYSIGLRWRPTAMHWLSFMMSLAFAAMLLSMVFWLFEISREGLILPGPNGWLLILYVGLFPSLVAQTFYARGVDLIGANRAGLFINLVPIFGSLLAVVLLGEDFRWYHAAGLFMVISGILLAEKSARKTI